jgi:glycosyltransferase involved in cell wall biosynthesis
LKKSTHKIRICLSQGQIPYKFVKIGKMAGSKTAFAIPLTLQPLVMEYRPLVSIITIVFNGEKHLAQTIESVIGQSYPEIEYIIIDGGSTDRSIDIIRKYEQNISYWISEKDDGISDAFNKGILRAKGEIVGIINADDWYEPDAVEKAVKNMSNYQVAYGDLSYWKDGKREMTVKGNHHHLQNEMSVNHPTVFIKRECYLNYGLFSMEYKYAMDYDLLLNFMQKGCKFVHVHSVLANMRWEGLSDVYWKTACRELMKIKEKHIPHKKLFHRFYYYKQVSVIALGRILNKIGFHPIVRFYRSRLSPMEKTY